MLRVFAIGVNAIMFLSIGLLISQQGFPNSSDWKAWLITAFAIGVPIIDLVTLHILGIDGSWLVPNFGRKFAEKKQTSSRSKTSDCS